MRITVLGTGDERGKPDVVVGHTAQALKERQHAVSVLAAHNDVRKLISGLARRKPDLVFNVLEEFGPTMHGAIDVAALLDMLDYRFTGGGPGELFLGQDKALTKKLLAFEGIRFPDFAVFSKDAEMETGGNLRLPLFVKPLRMEASIGVDAGSLVRTPQDMMERVLFIHNEVGDSALAEEFIEGREFYVSVLGNLEPTAFPPVEMDFSKLPPDKPHILDGKAKWEKGSVEYKGTESKLPELPDEVRARLQKVALDAYRALRVRDYGRIDLRLTDTGEIYVIEVHASCYLDPAGEFAMAAKAAGVEYPELIERIAHLAMERHGATNSPV
jgi:D-alanine-D-alanine ligase